MIWIHGLCLISGDSVLYTSNAISYIPQKENTNFDIFYAVNEKQFFKEKFSNI